MGPFDSRWGNVPWQCPEPMSHFLMYSQQSQSFWSRGALLWRQMVQNQAGVFTGSVVVFIDLAIDVVRFSNLTQDHTGSWRNSWQKSLCLPAKWSFPKTVYLPQETSFLTAAWPPPRSWAERWIQPSLRLPIHSVFPLGKLCGLESLGWVRSTKNFDVNEGEEPLQPCLVYLPIKLVMRSRGYNVCMSLLPAFL